MSVSPLGSVRAWLAWAAAALGWMGAAACGPGGASFSLPLSPMVYAEPYPAYDYAAYDVYDYYDGGYYYDDYALPVYEEEPAYYQDEYYSGDEYYYDDWCYDCGYYQEYPEEWDYYF